MTIQSDVKLELQPIEGEGTEGYIARLRDMFTKAALAHVDSQLALQRAREQLVAMRRDPKTDITELQAGLDKVLELSRIVATCRYEKETIEFSLSEVFHVVNR
ncbi:MAG: hypothetical protein ACO1OB_01230 [Archangium sp.]